MNKMMKSVIGAAVALAGLTTSALAHADEKMYATYAGMYYGSGWSNDGKVDKFFEDEATESWQMTDNCATKVAPVKGVDFREFDRYGLNLDCLIYSVLQSRSNTYFYRFSYNSNTHWNKFGEFMTRLHAKNPNIKVYAYIPVHNDLLIDGIYTRNLKTIATKLSSFSSSHPNFGGMGIDDYSRATREHPDIYNEDTLNDVSNFLKSNGGNPELLITAYWHDKDFLRNTATLDKYRVNCSNGTQHITGGCYSFDGVIFPLLSYYDLENSTSYNGAMPSNAALASSIATVQGNLLSDTKLIPLFYATGVENTFNTTAAYLKSTAPYVDSLADGVFMYHLQTDHMTYTYPWKSPEHRTKRMEIMNFFKSAQ